MSTWQMDHKFSHFKIIVDLARSIVVNVQLFSKGREGAMGES